MTKPAPQSHTLIGDPAHLGCGGRCRYLNHLGQKVLGKRKLGQSPNSTVVICHFKGTPPGRTESLGEKALSSWANFTCSETQGRGYCIVAGGWGISTWPVIDQKSSPRGRCSLQIGRVSTGPFRPCAAAIGFPFSLVLCACHLWSMWCA